MKEMVSAFPLIARIVATALTSLGSGPLGGKRSKYPDRSSEAMKMMTLDEALLDRLPQKQMTPEIQQHELSVIFKIQTQIEEPLNNC